MATKIYGHVTFGWANQFALQQTSHHTGSWLNHAFYQAGVTSVAMETLPLYLMTTGEGLGTAYSYISHGLLCLPLQILQNISSVDPHSSDMHLDHALEISRYTH